MSEPDEIDWPWEDYLPPERFQLRESYDYLVTVPFDSGVLTRLQECLSDPSSERLQSLLDKGCALIKDAIENSDLDAQQALDKHQVWLPKIGDSYSLLDAPVEGLIESMDVWNCENDARQQLSAALGLWCFYEYLHTATTGDTDRALTMLEQTALALSEAQFYRGVKTADTTTSTEMSERNRAAALKRHEANAARKMQAFELWESREWRVQADAERAISIKFNITQPVAGRWIREFKRSSDAYRALQSKHSASQGQ